VKYESRAEAGELSAISTVKQATRKQAIRFIGTLPENSSG
jgi:hypothetical protein